MMTIGVVGDTVVDGQRSPTTVERTAFSGWVIWANRGAADNDNPTGFCRIISK